jgi:hypothetical protein
MTMTKKRLTVYFAVVGKDDVLFLDKNNKVTQYGLELMKIGLDFTLLIVFCRDREEAEQMRKCSVYRNYETKVVGIESLQRIIKGLIKL